MAIIIRPAIPSDAAALLRCMKVIGGQTDNLTFGSEGLPFTEEDEAAFLASFSQPGNGVFYVALDDDEIIGSASLSVLPLRMAHRAELGISILKEYWGQGIGSAFTERIVGFARQNGIEIIELQVRCDNTSAIRLYEKFGFQKLCTYPRFFKIGTQYADFDYMILNLI